MMIVLVVGGAGYIGSHTVRELQRNGYKTIVLYNLVYGHREAVKDGDFIEGDLGNIEILRNIFETNTVNAVMHFAAYTYVGESVLHPKKYYSNNVINTLNLLDSTIRYGIKYFIFSSSCATYGEPQEIPITESHPQNPINPYGWSKLMVERILQDYDNAYGLKYISLRYFNAAGADLQGDIGEDHNPETHLIPLILRVALETASKKKSKGGSPQVLKIYGNDYPTKDGTCIRDYIHVTDIAMAHIMATERLLEGGHSDIYNLGNGEGYSVKDVVDVSQQLTGIDIPYEYTKRREGDPAILVGSSKRIAAALGWRPQYSELEQIILTAWKWHKEHPYGFKKGSRNS